MAHRQRDVFNNAANLEQVVIIDNGGGTCKVGLGGQPTSLRIFPNCAARAMGERHQLLGPALDERASISGLTVRRPVERGYLVNTELQSDIWSAALRTLLHVKALDCNLVLTEPLLNLPNIQDATDQLVFEELGFRRCCVLAAPALSVRHWAAAHPAKPAAGAACGLVLDAGFSFTHAAPVFDGQVLPSGVRRINLGGKALTNYMKELVSYRSMNMREETVLMEHVKEQLCFVSQHVRSDLTASRRRDSPFRTEYVLPDGVANLRGYIRTPYPNADQDTGSEQVLTVNNERFMVPEALFHPTDIGMNQAGLAETLVRAAEAVHPDLHGLLYSNVLLTGGMCRCPGFRERLLAELRPLVPAEYALNVSLAEDPVSSAWQGASQLAASSAYAQMAWSKAEYEEQGSYRMHTATA